MEFTLSKHFGRRSDEFADPAVPNAPTGRRV